MNAQDFDERFAWTETENGCWINPQGPNISVQQPSGKKRASIRGRVFYLDRLAYFVYRGRIENGMILKRTCQNIDCINQYHGEILEHRHVANGLTSKPCKKCGEIKQFTEFEKRNDGDGRKTICINCQELSKINAIARHEEIINRKAAIKNEKLLKRQQPKPGKTPEQIAAQKAKAAEYAKRIYHDNPRVHVYEIARRRIYNKTVIKGYKTLPALELLGCTREQYVTYIESLFIDGMAWNNHGVTGWHIDHIESLSKFDLSNIEQQRIAFHYTNTQPLWAQDNMAKHRKRYNNRDN